MIETLKDIEAKNMLLSRLQHSKDAHVEIRAEWEDNFSTYLARRETSVYPWESNITVPAVFDAVETHVPHIVAEDIELRAIPREGANPTRADILDAILRYDSDRMSLSDRIVPLVKQGLITGSSWFYLGYQLDKRLQRVREFQTVFQGTPIEFQMPTTRDIEVTRHDGPWMSVLDNHDVYPQPGKTFVNGINYEGMDWIIWRFVLPRKALEVLHERGVLLRGAYGKLKETDYNQMVDETRASDERFRKMGIDSTRVDDTVDSVEILAMYGDRGRGEKMDGLIWLGNRSVILRNEPHPLHHGDLPFGLVTDIPVCNQLFGLGEATILKQYQDEKSDLRNARMDNVHMVVNKMWMRQRNSGIDPNQLNSRPGGVIDVESMADLQMLPMGDVAMSSYQEEDMLQQDIERTAGSLDVLRGQRLGGDRSSATENELLAEFASARTKIKLMGLKQCLRQTGRWMIQIAKQFTTEEKTIRIIGPDRKPQDVQVSPQDLIGQWDVVPVIEQKLPLTRARRRQELGEMSQLLGPFVGEVVNPTWFAKQVLKAYGHGDDAEALQVQNQAAEQLTDPSQIAQQALAEGGEAAPPPQQQVDVAAEAEANPEEAAAQVPPELLAEVAPGEEGPF